MKLTKITCLLSCFFLASVAFANTANLVKADNQIKNLDTALSQVKKEANVPVVFPTEVPSSTEKQPYYANRDVTPTQNGYSYWINVDSTADCNGVKVCNIGNLTARKDATQEQFVDKDNKQITEKVKLANGIEGYFTPSHAMGDFFPANIQWMNNGVLYSLTWSKDISKNKEKKIMIAMANSAISSQK